MRTHGKITRWNDDRGFGFIRPAGAEADLFVHVSAFPQDGVRPRVDELISFEVEAGPDGRQRAVRVMRAGQLLDLDSAGNICAITIEHASRRANAPHMIHRHPT